jgi:hypothetical protein
VNGRGDRVNLNVNMLTAHRVRHPERSEGSPSRPDQIPSPSARLRMTSDSIPRETITSLGARGSGDPLLQ